MRGRILLVVSFVAVIAASMANCSPPPPIEAQYGPGATTMLTPFPSDRYTTADPSSPTGLRVALSTTTTADTLVPTFPDMVAQLDALDGFSTLAGVSLTFSGPLDVRGIADDPSADPPLTETPADPEAYQKPDAPMFLIDVDPASPDVGKLVGLVPRYFPQDADGDFVADYTLLAQPAVPLRERTRYLFAATNRLMAQSGGAVTASADTTRMTTGVAADDYEKKVQDALGVLEQATGVLRKDVVLATVFTTESVTGVMSATAQRARAQPPPAQVDPWTVETPIGADNRVRFRATFETPEYRATDTKKWKITGGVPDEQAKVPLEVFLAFADGTKSGPRPIVIYQHGLGGDKDGTWGTTERLAALGCAVIGIDSPEHGSRAPNGSTDQFVDIEAFLGVNVDTKTFDIGVARDNFRQMASDQLELVRFIDSLATLDLLPVGAPDGIPDLDVSRVLYIGHSFGAVQGATIFALAPEITQAVWNVGGANLTVLLRDSPLFSLALGGLEPPGTSKGTLARFFVAAQALVDPGDPAAYAPYATLRGLDGIAGWTPRDVLLQEVVNDNIVPNSSAEVLARAAGLAHAGEITHIGGLPVLPPPITGNLPGGNTGAIAQFDHINGTDPATHGELIFSPEGIQQYVSFFQSGLSAAHATVVSSY